MALVTMREALNQALREEMLRDESVFLMGDLTCRTVLLNVQSILALKKHGRY